MESPNKYMPVGGYSTTPNDQYHDDDASSSPSASDYKKRTCTVNNDPHTIQPDEDGTCNNDDNDEADNAIHLVRQQDANAARALLSSSVVFCILMTETAERFAFFGFRALLVLYFTQALQYPEHQAVALYAYVGTAAYISPLPGALLADGKWGRYRTIVNSGIIYVIGLIILSAAAWMDHSNSADQQQAIAEENHTLILQRWLSFGGLFLACLGTGGIKTTVSAFGADQIAFRTQQTGDEEAFVEEQVRAFFNYFYFCINLGALTSIFILPLIRGHFGFGPAISISACCMTLALFIFVSKRGEYVHEPSHAHHESSSRSSSSLGRTFAVIWWLLRYNLWHYNAGGKNWFQHCLPSSWQPGPFHSGLSSQRSNHRPHTRLSTVDDDDDNHDEFGQKPYSDIINVRPGVNIRRCSHIDTCRPNPAANGEGVVVAHDDRCDDDDDVDSDHSPISPVDDTSLLHDSLEDAARALHVLPILAMYPIFWTLYDQQSSVWTLQATRMKLDGLEPEQLNIINPLEIMVFIPLFDRILYPAMHRAGWNIAPIRLMAWGMFLAALSFIVSGILESCLDHRVATGQDPVHVLWQLPQITILAISEIFLSVTGLEFAYSTAPARLKTFLMAMFLLTTAVGDFFAGILYSTVFSHFHSRAAILHTCAALMLVNLVWFHKVTVWYESNTHHDLLRGIWILNRAAATTAVGSHSIIKQQQQQQHSDHFSHIGAPPWVEDSEGMEMVEQRIV